MRVTSPNHRLRRTVSCGVALAVLALAGVRR